MDCSVGRHRSRLGPGFLRGFFFVVVHVFRVLCVSGGFCYDTAMNNPRVSQEDIDLLADVLWWVKGALDSGGSSPFGQEHVDALCIARGALTEVMEFSAAVFVTADIGICP